MPEIKVIIFFILVAHCRNLMPKDRSHLLYTKAPEGTETFIYNQRYPDPKERETIANRSPDFSSFLRRYEIDLEDRVSHRNANIEVPTYIICVELTFFSWFNSSVFEVTYNSDYGLSPIKYSELNTKVLFAVIDSEKFKKFIQQLKKYSECKDHNQPTYDINIRFIKDFRFHSAANILKEFSSNEETVYLSLINNIELDYLNTAFVQALSNYLNESNAQFAYNPASNEFEIKQIDEDSLVSIAQNFDFVHSINSSQYMITTPKRYEIRPIAEYPFDVADPEAHLTTIGVIDTGVSVETPLSKLVVNDDNSYGLNGLNPRIDEADDGYGHGTSVAALAALGSQLSGNIPNTLHPDAKILSIKVLQDKIGKISNQDIISLIEKANDEYNIKLFTLTICYSKSLKTGAPPSDYAYLLDKLAYDRDILIFICTANCDFDLKTISTEYPKHFLTEETNFCTPAESMNNFTVGAIGDNLEPELPISPEKYPFTSHQHPAVYGRKYHLDYSKMTTKNARIVKPDVVYAGGNYTCVNDAFGLTLDSGLEAGLQTLTASRLNPIIRTTGTSYATPLIANIAAKISNLYPTLKPQTIKALIINSAIPLKLDATFKPLKAHEKRFITGHGKPDLDACMLSDNNSVTIVIQDSIKVKTVKTLPIRFPDYLNKLDKESGILTIEASLCYRFVPLKDNHLAYCPVNVAFGICKNIPIVDDRPVLQRGRRITEHHGISGGSKEKVALFKDLWSQDAWSRGKLLSNTQKMTFKVGKHHLLNENNIFKVAVQCHFHKVLAEYIIDQLPVEYEYSLVIKITESEIKGNVSNRLYTDLKNLNSLIAITDINIDAENLGDLDIN